MQLTQQGRRPDKDVVGPGLIWPRSRLAELPRGTGKDLTFDETQDLTILAVCPDHSGRPLEPHALQMTQESVDGGTPGHLSSMDSSLRAEGLPTTVALR